MGLEIFSEVHFAMVVEFQFQTSNNGLGSDRFGNTIIYWKYGNPKNSPVNKPNINFRSILQNGLVLYAPYIRYFIVRMQL